MQNIAVINKTNSTIREYFDENTKNHSVGQLEILYLYLYHMSGFLYIIIIHKKTSITYV